MANETPQPPSTALAKPQQRSPLADVAVTGSGVHLKTFDEMFRYAQVIWASGLTPKGIPTVEGIVIALQMGAELGLPAMASLQNIAVINGRPALWGDAMLAVVRSTGELEEFEEWYEAGGKRLPRNPVEYNDDVVAVCRVKRKGEASTETGFSVADAKRAKLWQKPGPWQEYPFRQMRFRARGYSLRDGFGDALRGLIGAEEAGDIPTGGTGGFSAADSTAALNQKLAAAASTPIDQPFEGEIVDPSRPAGDADSQTGPEDAHAAGEAAGKAADTKPADPQPRTTATTKPPTAADKPTQPADQQADQNSAGGAGDAGANDQPNGPAGDTGPAQSSEPITHAGGDSKPAASMRPVGPIDTLVMFVELLDEAAMDAGKLPEDSSAVLKAVKLSTPIAKDTAEGKAVRGKIIDAARAGKLDWATGKIVE